MRTLCLVSLLLLLFISSSRAYDMVDEQGHFNGVEYTTIRVNEINYEIPIGNDERKNQIFYLKKALKGDKEALDMFVGNNDYVDFPIGSLKPLWIRVTKEGNFRIE